MSITERVSTFSSPELPSKAALGGQVWFDVAFGDELQAGVDVRWSRLATRRRASRRESPMPAWVGWEERVTFFIGSFSRGVWLVVFDSRKICRAGPNTRLGADSISQG